MIPVQEEISHSSKRKKSKRKKEKYGTEDEQSQIEEKETLATEEADRSGSKKSHKSKKHKTQEEEDFGVGIPENQSLEAQATDTGDKKSKKKKSKKKRLDKESDDAQGETAGGVISKEHKKINSEKITVGMDAQAAKTKKCTDDVTEGADETKLKKRVKGGHAEEVDPVHDPKVDDIETSNKPKKRKKHNKEIGDDITQIETEQESPTKRKKHKKSKSKDIDCGDEKSSSSNKAVTDLQAEPELKAKPAAKPEQDNVVQGQWQGSLFDNSDRQNKFLRLMGGRKAANQQNNVTEPAGATKKKGLFGSLVPSSSNSLVSGNAALSASAAADLNRKLEEEYNKAMNFKLTAKKGSGFGFAPDPAEGKKFHIDVFKTKSVQFDD
ncbi:unnamed protein product [Lymnaea stagnalis]|uniref:Small acidic protein-like domain-containing protein n=1 Tax=Lymnaea stagnalis TaxID=6523 RepID=A0AAV2HD97_LYMST